MARAYRPLGEPQSLEGIYNAIKTEIKILENPAKLDSEPQRLPYLTLGRGTKKQASTSLPTSTSPQRQQVEGSPGRRFFKQEIADSNQRMRNVRAGKPLTTVFRRQSKQIHAPDASKYSEDRLGTPSDVANGTMQHRRKFFSLYDSSPQRKYFNLPSLLELVNMGRRRLEQHSEHLPLPERILMRLDHVEQTKSFRKTLAKTDSPPRGNPHHFASTSAALSAVFGDRPENEVLSTTRKLQEVVSSLEVSKTRLEKELESDLVTLRNDRADAISLKQKHFHVTSKGTNAQTMVLDLERMRIRAEIERINQYRGMLSHLEWYKDMLTLVINENSEITPVTYYVMDSLKTIIEAGCERPTTTVKELVTQARRYDSGANTRLIEQVAVHWGVGT